MKMNTLQSAYGYPRKYQTASQTGRSVSFPGETDCLTSGERMDSLKPHNSDSIGTTTAGDPDDHSSTIDFVRYFAEQFRIPPRYAIEVDTGDSPIYLRENDLAPLGHSAYTVFDVPDYMRTRIISFPGNRAKRITVPRYRGFLMDLTKQVDTDDYLTACFGKSTRSRFRKYQKRLELCFDIRYCMYYGEMEKAEYNRVFDCLRLMLQRRFDQKKVVNGELEKMDYYRQITYQRILNREASIFVIYDGDKPIDININYIRNQLVFAYMNGYDIDYSKFNLGMIDLIKLLEWSYEQGFHAIDLLKGDFEYKRRWSNHIYHHESHFVYNPDSVFSYLKALLKSIIQARIPQGILYFKKWNLHLVYKKIQSWRFKQYRPDEQDSLPFEVLPETEQELREVKQAKSISLKDEQYSFLRGPVYDFLYSNPEPLQQMRIYELEAMRSYLLSGSELQWRIVKTD